MKRISLFWSLFCMVLFLQAQAPAGYYDHAKGKSGAGLKTALFGIVSNHTQRTYKQLWEDFKKTDVRSDGKIWDMYSSVTNYEPGGKHQGANYKGEGDSYNREHSFPKSWFNDEYPMYTDLFHLYPTDGYVNNRRSNYPFGENNGETYKSKNGFSKLGKCTTPGYSGTVFEPNDEYKGDFARTYFYMATAYEDRIAGWNSSMLAGNKYPAYAEWVVPMLLRWAAEDPVSEKEIKRNNEVYKIQHNRNPYIDFPGLEQYVWGSMTSTPFDPDNYQGGGTNPEQPVVQAPLFSQASGVVAKGTEVYITTATQGASIHYVVNDGEEQVSHETVKLTINENTSVSAYAMLENAKSQTVTANYTLKGDVPTGSEIYVQVTDEKALYAGQRVLIVSTSAGTAMAEQREDIRGYCEVQPETDGTLTTAVNQAGKPISFQIGGQSGSWTLMDQAAHIYLALTADKNKLHQATEANAQTAQWTIQIDHSGEALIANCKYPGRAIKYNTSSPRFATYKSGQASVSLFALLKQDLIDQTITTAQGGVVRVYDINGRLIRQAADVNAALQHLEPGVYVVNSRKILVR